MLIDRVLNELDATACAGFDALSDAWEWLMRRWWVGIPLVVALILVLLPVGALVRLYRACRRTPESRRLTL